MTWIPAQEHSAFVASHKEDPKKNPEGLSEAASNTAL